MQFKAEQKLSLQLNTYVHDLGFMKVDRIHPSDYFWLINIFFQHLVFSSKLRAGAFPGSLIVQMWSGLLKCLQLQGRHEDFCLEANEKRRNPFKFWLVLKGLTGISLEKFTGLKRQAQLSSYMSHHGSVLNLSLGAHAFEDRATLSWFCTHGKAH